MKENVKLKDRSQFVDETGKVQWTDDKVFSANTMARILHLSVDPEALQILTVIFSGAPADANDERAVLDDKSARSAALWLRLSTEFVNNPAWKPQNTFGAVEPLIATIDPSKVPVRNLRGDELRAQFSKCRSSYTIAYLNFKKSGMNVEDANHLAGDDEFKNDFSRSNSVTVYQRHL